MDFFKHDDEFKKNIGNFILTFSEIEFTIGRLITIIENGVSFNKVISEIQGLTFKRKTSRLSKLLIEDEKLYKNWEKILTKIDECNQFRRGISHGVVMNVISTSGINILISHKNKFKYLELTNDLTITKLRLLHDINTGKNGLGQLREDIENWLRD